MQDPERDQAVEPASDQAPICRAGADAGEDLVQRRASRPAVRRARTRGASEPRAPRSGAQGKSISPDRTKHSRSSGPCLAWRLIAWQARDQRTAARDRGGRSRQWTDGIHPVTAAGGTDRLATRRAGADSSVRNRASRSRPRRRKVAARSRSDRTTRACPGAATAAIQSVGREGSPRPFPAARDADPISMQCVTPCAASVLIAP